LAHKGSRIIRTRGEFRTTMIFVGTLIDISADDTITFKSSVTITIEVTISINACGVFVTVVH